MASDVVSVMWPIKWLLMWPVKWLV